MVASITGGQLGVEEPQRRFLRPIRVFSQDFGGAYVAQISCDCHKDYTLRVLMIEAPSPP